MSGAGSDLVTTAIEEAVNSLTQLGAAEKRIRRKIETLGHKAGKTRLRARSAKLNERDTDVLLEYPNLRSIVRHCRRFVVKLELLWMFKGRIREFAELNPSMNRLAYEFEGVLMARSRCKRLWKRFNLLFSTVQIRPTIFR